ncbi:hypothetical protein IAU60_004138 [Kwoniella sp. DSM 27419]
MADRSSQLGLASLHDVVLQYLTTSAHASTARVLAHSKRRQPTTHQDVKPTGGHNGDADPDGMDLDEDGAGEGERGSTNGKHVGTPTRRSIELDEEALASIDQRRAIINHILNGAITRAVDALNAHFPAVLADPQHGGSSSTASGSNGHSNGISQPAQAEAAGNMQVSSIYTHSPNKPAIAIEPNHSLPVLCHSTYPSHVRLNLQIQQFIESFRQVSPSSPAPSSPSSSIGSLGNSGTLSNSTATLTNALTAAQGLHTEAKKLSAEVRAMYLREIKDVGALFAYSNPEKSILKGFLEQSRRIRLADQVNAAILHSQGEPTQSFLEAFARRTIVMYGLLAKDGIDPRPDLTALNGGTSGQGGQQLVEYWKHNQGKRFDLHEFVNQTW